MTLGELIRVKRIAAGLSLKELARELKTPYRRTAPSVAERWEANDTEPAGRTLIAIMVLLGISIEEVTNTER